MIKKHTPEIYHLTFGPHKPAMKLKDGDEVQVQVPDCDGLGADGKPLSLSKFKKGLGIVQIANPMAGPYLIENAVIGDSVTIHIKNIEIDSNFGRTGISAKQITIPQKFFINEKDNNFNAIVPTKEFSWRIDHKNKTAIFCCEKSEGKKNVKIDLDPSVGCIGVAPENGQFIDGLSSGNYGGNIDIPGLGAGCSITFPVFVKGAHLFLGDLHAAQGDGEIIGGAIEVSGTVAFQISVNKNKALCWPRMETQDRIGVIATGSTIDEAMQIAYSQLTLWISDEYKLNRWEVLNIVSQIGKARAGNSKTAICTIAKNIFL